MFAIPKPMLKGLGLHPNQQVEVSISEGRMIVEATVKARYSLAELLAECDFSQPMTTEDRQWLDSTPVGGEVI
jgi:antitoxin ChpS